MILEINDIKYDVAYRYHRQMYKENKEAIHVKHVRRTILLSNDGFVYIGNRIQEAEFTDIEVLLLDHGTATEAQDTANDSDTTSI